ncbi:anti-sigma factor [Arthrobacter sp. KK5.5]|uniref:anti-sigma factor n=1 Tax=Arthrobacter sp. KK5.5 TaxID=3373084 RepID=UPI003EE7776A
MRQSDSADARDFDDEPEENLGLNLVDEVAEHRPQRRAAPVRKWMLLVAAAVVAVIGVVSLFSALAPRDMASEVDGASDRAERTVEVPGGGTATVAVSPSNDAGSVAVSGLPAPSQGTTYQLWVVSAETGALSSLELVEGVEATAGFRGLDDVQGVALTSEPEGGSDKPSSDPVVTVDLPTR